MALHNLQQQRVLLILLKELVEVKEVELVKHLREDKKVLNLELGIQENLDLKVVNNHFKEDYQKLDLLQE